MDVIRLTILYDTITANQRLKQLEDQLRKVNGSNRTTATSAARLANALATGNISAQVMTRSLMQLGGRAGIAGAALAVAAGFLVLLKRHTDRAREAAHKFADQLRTTRRAVDELLRPDVRSPLQGEIEKITDAILELDRVLARQRLNLLERWFGGASPKAVIDAIRRYIFGGEDPATRRQRGALTGERNRLTNENLGGAMALRATNDLNRIRTFSTLTRGTLGGQLADEVKRLEQELEALLVIFPESSEEVQQTALAVNRLNDAMRRQLRAEQLVTSGLETMADTLEDFVVTGTLAFTDFLNNILRLLYRDFTGELVHGIVRSAFGGIGPTGTSGDMKDVGGVVKSSGMSPSVTTNVNFTIQAMDTQTGAQWIQRNAPQIAAEIGAQAARSRGLRKMLTSG